MRGAIHPLIQYAFMAWYLVKHKDNFVPKPLHQVYRVSKNNLNMMIMIMIYELDKTKEIVA
jgi:hypothetical protein